MTNQALGGLQQIPHAYTQPDLVDDLVRVFDVDGIFDCPCAGLVEVVGRDLDQVFNRRLEMDESVTPSKMVIDIQG